MSSCRLDACFPMLQFIAASGARKTLVFSRAVRRAGTVSTNAARYGSELDAKFRYRLVAEDDVADGEDGRHCFGSSLRSCAPFLDERRDCYAGFLRHMFRNRGGDLLSPRQLHQRTAVGQSANESGLNIDVRTGFWRRFHLKATDAL